MGNMLGTVWGGFWGILEVFKPCFLFCGGDFGHLGTLREHVGTCWGYCFCWGDFIFWGFGFRGNFGNVEEYEDFGNLGIQFFPFFFWGGAFLRRPDSPETELDEAQSGQIRDILQRTQPGQICGRRTRPHPTPRTRILRRGLAPRMRPTSRGA